MENTPENPKYPNRFPPGVSGNPSGRPKGTGGSRLVAAFERLLTPEAVQAIAQKAIDQAQRGDRFAREDISKLYGLFQDRLHLSGAASILWNWQPPAADSELAEADDQGAESAGQEG